MCCNFDNNVEFQEVNRLSSFYKLLKEVFLVTNAPLPYQNELRSIFIVTTTDEHNVHRSC